MADPRADVRHVNAADKVFRTFKIDNSTITYSATEANGSAQVGLAVTLSADDTVKLVGDGERVVGKLIQVYADNYATVQIGGPMELPAGSGATLGHNGIILNDATTTAVVVEL